MHSFFLENIFSLQEQLLCFLKEVSLTVFPSFCTVTHYESILLKDKTQLIEEQEHW